MGLLEPVHPLFSLPLWAQPNAFSNLGNVVFTGTNRGSRVIEVIAQAVLEPKPGLLCLWVV